MIISRGPLRTMLLVALGATALTGISGMGSAVLADDFTFTNGGGDWTWENPDNWDSTSPGSLPGTVDNVIVPDGFETADVHDDRTIATLNGSSSVGVFGDLTVTDGIIVDGGYLTNHDTIHGHIVNNTYVSNLGQYFGGLESHGDLVNDGEPDDGVTATWTGDVESNEGELHNNGGIWNGKVVSNNGRVLNEVGGTWNGEVAGNEASIENDASSTWNGDIAGNSDVDGVISNEGVWNGTVWSNNGSINNHNVWTGELVSNEGSVVTDGVWNRDLVNSATGFLLAVGVVNGDIDNSGELFVPGVLSLAGDLTNSGLIRMNDDEQTGSNRIEAESWTGDGTAYFELETALGRGDHIVLSGDYSANTTIHFEQVGAAGRTLADIPVITVGGVNTGSITPDNLPGPGVISYDLVRSGESWLLTTTLNDAPDHAAAAAGLLSRTLAATTEVPLDRGNACGTGAWMRGLDANQNTTLGGVDSALAYGGGQFGYNLPCMSLGEDVTLGIGVTAGGIGGDMSQELGPDSTLDGSFEHAFGGVYADLAAGPWHAVLQGQIGVTDLSFSDPGAAVEAATLRTFRYGLSGNASYTLAFGDFSVAPELGFDASTTHSHSSDFADVGTMSLNTDPALTAHFGATVATRMTIADGMTLSPFASLSIHGDVVSPDEAEFVDGIGGTATVAANDSLGAYAELAVGADIVSAATASGGNVRAGIRGDLKRGDAIDAHSVNGYANVNF